MIWRVLKVNYNYENFVIIVGFCFYWVYYKVETFFLGGKANVSDV